ncbi:DEAD/DEAH box helicase [Planotetraspora thailandica]|uniref:DEAD/DEAH box helicase n=1 Tax=Planotetraspora thailandica TaxID=487172 RepID=UPI00195044A4|nr:DEAD/DEAH box helicase [Planotetraspora thailandica]
MADAEVQLFRRQTSIPDDLLETAWYLHAIASVDQAQQLYTVARQRQCFAVSAHVFDMALADPRWDRVDRLILGFAAGIGYRRGDRDPNETAIMRRLQDEISSNPPVLNHIDSLAVEAGLALIGFETRTLFTRFASWRRELHEIARLVELPDLATTGYGTTHAVILGGEDLLHYLARGDVGRLSRARERLLAATLGQRGQGELPARWVAYHLLALADEAATGSVWSPDLLPPDLPDAVRHAFTMGSPPVLTLWNPQKELLTSSPSPFSAQVRRMVLSVPTSSGKTMVAQLLALSYLETTSKSICYVAPTRSLCREVRRSMASRLRVLQKEAGPDRPDFPTFDQVIRQGGDIWDALLTELGSEDAPPDVEVMTPERLQHLLRHDAEGVLDRFGMFIFDEAQLIKEASRGFTLETTIAYLHHRTRDTEHRIILLSAAMGNAAQIARWIDPDGPAKPFESQWRGPRRLYALFTSEPIWDQTTSRPSKGLSPYRLSNPLKGKLALRLSDNRTVRLEIREPIGTLVRKANSPDQTSGTTKDSDKSDPNYLVASRMIGILGHAGTALVVTSTRLTAQRIARTLAAQMPEHPDSFALADFVKTQLGDEHPLVAVLRHGVGFHHAGLPIEVLEAIEDALRADILPYLTCTSTLTDGVNLPVHTVVIYDENYQGMNQELRLRGPRLVNAVGRAGRAGKETEGWIVLVSADPPSQDGFADLAPSAQELTVSSAVTDDQAFDEILALEAAAHADQDAVIRVASGRAADFVAFIWFYLADSESRGVIPSEADVNGLSGDLLAAKQDQRYATGLTALAHHVREIYQRTEPEARRRWPRTGTSIGSAQVIDADARRVADLIRHMGQGEAEELSRPGPAVMLLAELGILADLLTLPENTAHWRFRITKQGADIPVQTHEVLLDWLQGLTYAALAETHLAAITDAGRRIEEMVDAVTSHFEHFLAWTVGALVELTNTFLIDSESERRLCPELGPFIRYGVNDRGALGLMLNGLRSRRLAHEIARQIPEDLAQGDLHEWLASMGLTEWRDRFSASASEMLDLLDLTSTRGRSLLRNLLETASTSIELDLLSPATDADSSILALTSTPGAQQPAPIGLYAGPVLLARVRAADHTDVLAILDSGLELAFRLETTTLHISTTSE